jgi:hypothetical protein
MVQNINLHNLPAVSSQIASPKMSEKYGYVNSLEVASFLENEGWNLISATQRKIIKNSSPEKHKFASHWLRFRKPTSELRDRQVGDIIPEIYFKNSHDGTSGISFEAGLHRLVCSNGLVVKDKSFADVKLRHSIKHASELRPMLEEFVHGFSNLSGRINEMKEINLGMEEQLELAEIAKGLLWGQHIPKIEAQKIIQARREEDAGSDLWSVYNRVQENLSKGGLEGVGNVLTAKNEIRKVKTRDIKNIFKYVSFNSKLWETVENKMETGKFLVEV